MPVIYTLVKEGRYGRDVNVDVDVDVDVERERSRCGRGS